MLQEQDAIIWDGEAIKIENQISSNHSNKVLPMYVSGGS